MPIGLSIAAAVFNVARPGVISGLFIDYWLQFACGVAVFYRLTHLRGTAWAHWFDAGAAFLTVVVVAVALKRGELIPTNVPIQPYGQLAVCATFAVALVGLRRWDTLLQATWPVRLLAKVGRFSYSLYLIHQLLIEELRPVGLQLSYAIGWFASDVLVLAGVLGAAWLFSRIFEQPYLNRPLEEFAPKVLGLA